MKKNDEDRELQELTSLIKNNYFSDDTLVYKKMIYETMSKFPHSPKPHNLIGLLLEKEGNHILAMKHFRAAYSLDPTYLPAERNLNKFGAISSFAKCAFDELDC